MLSPEKINYKIHHSSGAAAASAAGKHGPGPRPKHGGPGPRPELPVQAALPAELPQAPSLWVWFKLEDAHHRRHGLPAGVAREAGPGTGPGPVLCDAATAAPARGQ